MTDKFGQEPESFNPSVDGGEIITAYGIGKWLLAGHLVRQLSLPRSFTYGPDGDNGYPRLIFSTPQMAAINHPAYQNV